MCRSYGAWGRGGGVGSYRHGAPTELFKSVHRQNVCGEREVVLRDPPEFERCCGWSRVCGTQPRSVEVQVHGCNACSERKVALSERAREAFSHNSPSHRAWVRY